MHEYCHAAITGIPRKSITQEIQSLTLPKNVDSLNLSQHNHRENTKFDISAVTKVCIITRCMKLALQKSQIITKIDTALIVESYLTKKSLHALNSHSNSDAVNRNFY